MALKEILADFKINVDDGQLKKGDAGVSKLTESLGKFGAILGGALTIGAIKSFVGGMVDASDQINDTSAQLGISGRELQRWSYAAGLSGASMGDVATAFKVLEKNAGGGSAAFAKVGISAAQLKDGLDDPAKLMHEVGEGIAGLKSPAERTKAALELLGKGGAKLIPIFNEGADGVDKMLDELDDLGGGYSDEALKALDDLGDNMHRLDTATDSLKARIAVVLVPVITRVVDVMTKWVASLSKNKAAAQALIVVVGALGAAALAAGVVAAAPWLLFAAVVAAAFLVVQDFVVFLNGGDSLIGRGIDKAFGAGSAAKVRDWINGVIADVKALFNGDGIAFDRLVAKAVDAIEQGEPQLSAALGEVFSSSANSAVESSDMNGVGMKIVWKILAGVFSVQSAFDKAILTMLGRAVVGAAEIGKEWASNLIAGLVEGIEAGAAAVKDKIKSLVDVHIKLPFMQGTDSHSPSKFTERLGGYLTDGLVNGLSRGEARVGMASTAQAQAVTRGFGNASVNMQNTNTFHVRTGAGLPEIQAGVSRVLADERESAYEALTSVVA